MFKKDDYLLMEKTIMPTIKQQILRLQQSAVVTVYQRANPTSAFRSYTVPSSIQPATIAFMEVQSIATAEEAFDTVDKRHIKMTYAFGDVLPSFGSIDIIDPVFEGIAFFEVAAKVVVNRFHDLFIGDLAFLPCNAYRNEQQLRKSLSLVPFQGKRV
jgi:hypothetical protein